MPQIKRHWADVPADRHHLQNGFCSDGCLRQPHGLGEPAHMIEVNQCAELNSPVVSHIIELIDDSGFC
jgi:hypothetical protein